jgi:hypothetical protein
MVLDALFHHASASRVDRRMGASGKVAVISRQNGAAGQSTVAA